MATKKKMLQAAAGQAGGAGLDITEVFSTYLYTGNGSTQTITNGIDLAGEGGLVWTKNRTGTDRHGWYDTARGVYQEISSNLTNAQRQATQTLTAFNSAGFDVGTDSTVGDNGRDYASWTFRKAPKFFDVVTYTGDGTDERDIAHNLGGPVGCLMVKCTSEAADWQVLHKDANRLILNSTAAQYSVANTAARFGDDVTITRPTSTHFTVSTPGNADTNKSGATYVAYLFAHNDGDGEFGPDGDQDIIKCGSYTGNGSTDGPEIDLGFEPQWVLVKSSTQTADWTMYDNMRGAVTGTTGSKYIHPNKSDAEATRGFSFLSNGFQPRNSGTDSNTSGQTYIYMAIRRGPLAPPESGTEVFATDHRGSATATAAGTSYYSGFPVDMTFGRNRTYAGGDTAVYDRLRGDKNLFTNLTNAEGTVSYYLDSNTGFWGSTQSENTAQSAWMWKRAPNFFDVVAYTGDGVAGRTVSHNLGVAPEMIWVKIRGANSGSWRVYHKDIGNTGGITLNLTNASFTLSTLWNNTSPSSTEFTLGTYGEVNLSGNQFIAYLFATLAGISKVGSYTGTGTHDTHVIDCGFTSGARFVLLKRTDATSDWFLWDSERGITTGADPRLSLNTTAAEYNGLDDIRPHPSGFIAANPNGSDVNALNSEWLFYAIA